MSEVTKNTFEGGIQQDIDIALSKANTVLYAENVRVLNSENTNYIITNLKGTDEVASLKPNYWCKGVRVTNGIAYILSAEIINGTATGRGEIGCFPSPDYLTGNITKEYRPFMNYKGDLDQFPDYDGELNSKYFNFKDNVRVEVEIQQEYDGSVNVVFTDGINPIRIINSGFSKKDNTYKKVERVGVQDSNKYDKNTWESGMSLIQGYSTLSQVEFVGTVPGGTLTAGNYTFTFRYSSVEKNKSEIICQTFPLSIYSGTSLTGGNSIKGDIPNSAKSVKLLLSGLDTSYAYIHVDYILEKGSDTEYKSLTNDYPINSSELELIISGGEPSTASSDEEVGLIVTAFNSAKSITQIQNRLVVANVTKAGRNFDVLRQFAASIIPKFKEVPIEARHNEGLEGMQEVENLEDLDSFGDGRSWNIGYANNKNIYLRRGYWGGETYGFGIRGIYKDLTVSPVFPTFGYDDQTGDVNYTLNPALTATIESLINGNTSGYSTTDSTNVNGIYRFPTRTCAASNSLLSGGGVNTYAISFDIPDLDTVFPGGSILDEIIGIEFVRSERVKDCLFQGVGLACYPFHPGPPINGMVWNDTNRGVFNSVMPLIRGTLPVHNFRGKYAASRKLILINLGADEYLSDFQNPPSGTYANVEGDNLKDDTGVQTWNVLVHQNQSWNQNQLSEANASVDSVSVRNYTGIYSPEFTSSINELSPILNGEVNLNTIRLGRQVAVVRESGLNNLVITEIPLGAQSEGDRQFYLSNDSSPQLFYVNSTSKTGSTLPAPITRANYVTKDSEFIGNFRSFLPSEVFIHYPESNGHIAVFLTASNCKTPSYWGVKDVSLLENLTGYAGYTARRDIEISYYDANFILPQNIGTSGGDNAGVAAYNVNTVRVTNGSNDKITFENGEYFNFFNVYQGNTGMTTWDNIKTKYSTSSLKYTPISQRLFLTTGVGNAVYDPAVVAQEITFNELYYDDNFTQRNSLIPSGTTVTKPVVLWGGDCYIAPYIVKVVSSENSDRGIYMSVFLESSVNPILMKETDIFPFTQSRLDNGFVQMSEAINPGFLKTISKVPYTSLDFNAPFIKVEFDTRVYYSDIHLQNNFKNAYKVFGLASYKDYTKHLGPITKVVNIKNTLFLIQQTGISVIPVNERITEAESATGSIYLAQSDILSQYVVAYSEVYGTDLQFACVPTSDNLYVLDLQNFKMLCLTPTRGVEFISDLKLESFIRKYLQPFLGQTRDFTNLDIVGFDHTTNHKEIVWTFYDKSDLSKLRNISLAYNIALKQFTSFYSMVPYQTFGLDGIQYAFNSKVNPEKIHSLETNPIRNLIFEEPEKSIVRFKVADRYEFEKVFDNLSVISNNVLPTNVLYYVDGGNTNQAVTYDPVNIHLSNAKHREGVTYITIPRVDNITDKDVTEFLDALYTNAMSQLNTVDVSNEHARFKGKSIIIELQYNTDKQLKLNSVLTQYRISNS